MFRLINRMLQLDNFYGVHKDIDILKGVYKYPLNINDSINIFIRKIRSDND